MKIPIEAIKVDDHSNPRGPLTVDQVGDLIESIRSQGLLSPIAVTAEHRLICGHRRLLAIKTLGWTEVEATIVDPQDELQVAAMRWQENKRRTNPDALSEALWLASLASLPGIPKSRIEAGLGITEGSLQKAERVAKAYRAAPDSELVRAMALLKGLRSLYELVTAKANVQAKLIATILKSQQPLTVAQITAAKNRSDEPEDRSAPVLRLTFDVEKLLEKPDQDVAKTLSAIWIKTPLASLPDFHRKSAQYHNLRAEALSAAPETESVEA